MFIGRETELAFLNARYEEKTRAADCFIRQTARRQNGNAQGVLQGKTACVFLLYADNGRDAACAFFHTASERGYSGKTLYHAILGLGKAFVAILDLPYGEQKKLVVIDEFPYMCKGNPSIPSILQNLWDAQLKDSNVMLILCGSAMSFIEKELLAEKNPLYGRATGIYRMREMGFYDAMKFFRTIRMRIKS